MIGISADFDPVHKGHEKLIKKGLKIKEKTGEELVIYLNKGYSANHAPFFVDFELRKEMALACGADRVVAVEGLHHKLTLAYSVPIRIAMMIEDGVTEYVDAVGEDVSIPMIIDQSKKFAKKEVFSGIPRHLPNRNVIRWFAVNEFLYKKYKRKMNFHIIKELSYDDKVSGREIRKRIIKNNMQIPSELKNVLPKTTITILEKGISEGRIPDTRNFKNIENKLNRSSRSDLANTAYLNSKVINNIIKDRFYRDEESIWAMFRRSEYGPVLTRLSLSCIDEGVSKLEVMELIKSYEKKGIIPNDQCIYNVVNRAWFVSQKDLHGLNVSDANVLFQNGRIGDVKPVLSFDAGISVKNSEVNKLHEGLDVKLYVNNDGVLSCEMKSGKHKIKSCLKLSGSFATYLRLLLDSQFIPLSVCIVKRDCGFRVKIDVVL